MRKDYENLFSHLARPEPPDALFDGVMAAVAKERTLRRVRTSFVLGALCCSVLVLPFTWAFLSRQATESGMLAFLGAAAQDLRTFLALRKEFLYAIAESVPLAAVTAFAINLFVALVAFRALVRRMRTTATPFIIGLRFR